MRRSASPSPVAAHSAASTLVVGVDLAYPHLVDSWFEVAQLPDGSWIIRSSPFENGTVDTDQT